MNNIGYVLLFLISVFVSSCSQIALKKSANQKHENKIREIVNPLVLGAYACFFGASLLTVLGTGAGNYQLCIYYDFKRGFSEGKSIEEKGVRKYNNYYWNRDICVRG